MALSLTLEASRALAYPNFLGCVRRIVVGVSGTTAFAQSKARIDEICASSGDALALRADLLAEIRRVIDFDGYVWLLTDPESMVGAAPLAEVPPSLMRELPTLIRLKYATRLNRWTTLASPAALSTVTESNWSDSQPWRRLLQAHGVVDILSSVFRDRHGCWGFLDLWRAAPGATFTDVDSDFLAGITDAATAALRRGQAGTFVAQRHRPVDRKGPVVVMLSGALEMVGQTAQTLQYLRVLVPPVEGDAPVPAAAYNVAAQLLAVEAGVDGHQPSTRVHLSGGRWLTVRAARIGENITVTFEDSSPSERLSLFARAFALTPRETDLLRRLATGADNRTLARQMSLSEHTVQDHLKSIFAKTTETNRRSLLSRALGT